MWRLTPLKNFVSISACWRVTVIPSGVPGTFSFTLNNQNWKWNLHPSRRGSEWYCPDAK